MDLLDNLSSSTLNVYIELTNRIHGGMGWDGTLELFYGVLRMAAMIGIFGMLCEM